MQKSLIVTLAGCLSVASACGNKKGGSSADEIADALAGASADAAQAYPQGLKLVLLAESASGAKVTDLAEEIWDANFDTNAKGTFLMCQAVAPMMKRQKWGRILNAASYAAITPSIGSAAYASSKYAVVGFTRVLAGELGPYDVTVNCYSPGMVPTQMNRFADAPDERKEKLLDTLTLRRWGDPQDVANLLAFMASDLAQYITGTHLDCSGGKYATQFPSAAYEQI